MPDNFLYAQLQPFAIAGSGSSIGDTTLTLRTFQSIDGVALTMADFGTIGFGTIQPNALGYEEQICWTGVVQNPNGTATLTGVKNVAFLYPYTQTAGMKVSHPGGATFVVSNTSGFYDKLTAKDDDETINNVWTFTQSPIVPTPTTPMQAANKDYVDGVAIAGAPNASSTVKGITKLTLDPTVLTNPIAVGDNDTSATGSGSKVVRGTAGKIDMTWIPGGTANGVATLNGSSLVVQNPANATATPTAAKIPIADSNGFLDEWDSYAFFFGDGSDGNVTINAPTSLSKDMYYNNLTLNSTLNANGYKIFVAGTLTQNAGGLITNNGGNGGAGTDGSLAGGGNGGTAGTAPSANSLPEGVAGVAGANGSSSTGGSSNGGTAGSNGTAKTTCLSSTGGSAGGKGGVYSGVTGGGAGGSGGTTTSTDDKLSSPIDAFTLISVVGSTVAAYATSGGAGSGGSGGSAGNGSANTGCSGGGGGSGAGGGFLFVFARTLALQNGGTWAESLGGNGGKGGNGFVNGPGPGAGGGGGGAGGNGGVVITAYKTKSGTATVSVAGGIAGTFGTGAGTGGDGSAGSSGSSGIAIEFNL